MYIVDLKNGNLSNAKKIKISDVSGQEFIIVKPEEMIAIQGLFNFDSGTVIDCLNYDENIRHNTYKNYDFVSLIYFYLKEEFTLELFEINLYLGAGFCILVLPYDENDRKITELKDKLLARATSSDLLDVNRMFYFVFDALIFNYSNTLEHLEDKINDVESYLLNNTVDKSYLEMVHKIRQITYNIKKITRPLLYIGDAMLINENDLIKKDYMRYIKNIDTRLNKLYDFAISLQEYSNQMLNLYESKISMQTNEVINKLTMLTVFTAPLTVITGIYGMNFINMPELTWKMGYPLALLLMLSVSCVIYFILRLKKWL